MAANTYLTSEERTLLESARVGIAGAGGLGSNCAMHLVRSGVKHITIVDFDVVNESNLNRQFFFRDQIGQKKVEAIKENLLRIEPDADIRAVDMRLDASSARERRRFRRCETPSPHTSPRKRSASTVPTSASSK